jgi:hypothetical protein
MTRKAPKLSRRHRVAMLQPHRRIASSWFGLPADFLFLAAVAAPRQRCRAPIGIAALWQRRGKPRIAPDRCRCQHCFPEFVP